MLQYVILPCVAYSFEHGDTQTMIGTAPSPDIDNAENIVSLFVCDVIDDRKTTKTVGGGRRLVVGVN